MRMQYAEWKQHAKEANSGKPKRKQRGRNLDPSRKFSCDRLPVHESPVDRMLMHGETSEDPRERIPTTFVTIAPTEACVRAKRFAGATA